MIERHALLSDLQKLLRQLETDLRERCDEAPKIDTALRAEYNAAKEAERTAESFEEWRADYITQIAAAWVLTCVFARFLEDNCLVDPPKLSGPGDRLRRARDEHELYFRSHPTETDREYLLDVFDGLAKLPDGAGIFAGHNPMRQQTGWLSGDAARTLLTFFQRIEPETGELVHDFTDPQWDTRFLGDLYQDLSEAARKKYAFLQTPEFVEEFILDRTLDPAIEEFGLGSPLPPGEGQGARASFRMIDPACGSGHFLLGSFRRLFERWSKAEPGTISRELVQRALDSTYGVDINPYAVAIARFRLLLAALRACEITRLADAPRFRLNLVCGDSLLHGSAGGDQQVLGFHELAHVYQSEDAAELRRILRPEQYHAVVANPPYITVKDKALNQAYRERYTEVCHMKYSLSVPFMQRLFALAVGENLTPRRRGTKEERSTAGFVGQITSNSFMKREFGKNLIEDFLPKVDLTHVIDTGGAYIPGHGTPTVILFGRNRAPVRNTIRAALGIRGEPCTPPDPARGVVWSAILDQLDCPGSQSQFVSVGDSPREKFYKHPWSIGGGGAAELKGLLDGAVATILGSLAESIGITSFTLEDDIFLLPSSVARRLRLPQENLRTMVVGDVIRDWQIGRCDVAVFPYDADFGPIDADPNNRAIRYLWIAKTCLANNKLFGGKTKVQAGLTWQEYGRLTADKLRTPLSIIFANVATHNHFTLDRGGKVFKDTSPLIKLPARSTEKEHLGLLGLLNSCTACFWMKQVLHNKGSTVDQRGARQRTDPFEDFYQTSAGAMEKFPIPAELPLALARRLDDFASLLAEVSPARILQGGRADQTRQVLAERQFQWQAIRQQMIALQEELDWECYRLYGLTDQKSLCAFAPLRETPAIDLGQRPFEIVMARKMAAGELQTTWFERHGSTPITEIPADWPEDYRKLVERRIELIETDPNIRLIEQPEYKRRWNTEPWDEQLQRALRNWLLDRLESYFDFDGRMNNEGKPTAQLEKELVSTARLADMASHDSYLMQVAELYRGRPDFDVAKLVAELVEEESVPALPVLRYKPSGLDKRQAWERTWESQRLEDAIDARTKLPDSDPDHLTEDQARTEKQQQVGEIPVPPKYTSADFLPGPFWRLRGKLDVPKERWVSFPHCEGEDRALVVAWAGLDHLQLARAVSAYYVNIQEKVGGSADPRLVPLLASILELVPWLKQWHNDIDPEFNMRMGDYFENFVEQEARGLGQTLADVRAWKPPQRPGGRRKRS